MRGDFVPKISVIVPAYNVEKYLDRCIKSILDQKFDDFEVLLIDDGAQDSTSQICDKYATLDSRVKTYHKENGGLSDARNYGLDRMSGEYVTFIDSDDYIADNMLEEMLNLTSERSNAIAPCLKRVARSCFARAFIAKISSEKSPLPDSIISCASS